MWLANSECSHVSVKQACVHSLFLVFYFSHFSFPSDSGIGHVKVCSFHKLPDHCFNWSQKKKKKKQVLFFTFWRCVRGTTFTKLGEQSRFLPVVLTSRLCLCLTLFFRTCRVAWNTSAARESLRVSGSACRRNGNVCEEDNSTLFLGRDMHKRKWRYLKSLCQTSVC